MVWPRAARTEKAPVRDRVRFTVWIGHPLDEPRPAWHALRAFLYPGGRRILPYSIQVLKRWKPEWFREDLSALLNLLRDEKPGEDAHSYMAAQIKDVDYRKLLAAVKAGKTKAKNIRQLGKVSYINSFYLE
jgi:hypothetical protein